MFTRRPGSSRGRWRRRKRNLFANSSPSSLRQSFTAGRDSLEQNSLLVESQCIVSVCGLDVWTRRDSMWLFVAAWRLLYFERAPRSRSEQTSCTEAITSLLLHCSPCMAARSGLATASYASTYTHADSLLDRLLHRFMHESYYSSVLGDRLDQVKQSRALLLPPRTPQSRRR